MKRKFLSIIAMVLALGLMPAAATWGATGEVLVYTGEGALNEGYTNFGTAAGKTVQTLAALPADLSPFDCVVLPINGTTSAAFSPETTTALDTYVNNGGRIIALAEWDFFPGSIAAMNGLASAIGADLSVVSAAIDLTFHTTTNIDASPFTVGVDSISYAATSEVAVAVGPSAHSLVRSQGGTTFIGVDRIGSGVFVLSGDSNVFSASAGGGYVNHDNGTLVANICDQASFSIEVDLDIKPGSFTNSINPKSMGVVPVAILGSDTFDVTTVDVTTLAFGPGGAAPRHDLTDASVYADHLQDVNDDGLTDLVSHYRQKETGLTSGDTEACLTGEAGGIPLEGCDSVRVLGG